MRLLPAILVTFALAGCPEKHTDPIAADGVKLCPKSMCGSPPELPRYECTNGDPGGPSGRCVADEFDTCDWEILVCQDEVADCVIAGCENNLCVESGEDLLDECDYADRLDCDTRGICERQPDGVCGWTQTEEVVHCKKFGN